MFEARSSSPDRKRFLYLRVIVDYLKTNSHRIAHHALSRTTTPLASRNDIKPLLSLINGEIADIFTLDPNSKKTFVKSIESDELVAHFPGDIALNESLARIQGENLEDIHFIFVTNGILTPELLQIDYTGQYPYLSNVTFLETRFDSESIHKISNPSIYLRKVVGQVRQVETNFMESSSDNCECGGKYWQGTYKINYWGKSHSLTYSVCANCGIQRESADNPSSIMNFLIGLSAE
ncbi:MAG: hypothetical protein JSW11_03245 [Candidatus Heimdallarchaeota archaeon]|nr:MAG: hypothetical protein JSW11_03245 [Candidatus Heimdallarchaeota archaeon]